MSMPKNKTAIDKMSKAEVVALLKGVGHTVPDSWYVAEVKAFAKKEFFEGSAKQNSGITKGLDQLTKAALLQKAADCGINTDDCKTRPEIIMKIREHFEHAEEILGTLKHAETTSKPEVKHAKATPQPQNSYAEIPSQHAEITSQKFKVTVMVECMP